MQELPNLPVVAVLAGRESTLRADVLDVLRCRQSVLRALEERGYRGVSLDIYPRDLQNRGKGFLKKLEKLNPACIFNLFEGFSFDASSEILVCSLLESSRIPFTGNGSRPLELCLDKDKARRRIAAAGLPIPRGYALKKGQRRTLPSLNYPLFLKPQHQDGSLGIRETSLVRTPQEFERHAALLLEEFPQGILVEEFLSGAEYSVAFMGNREYRPMGVSVIPYEEGEFSFLNYDSKWTPESREFQEIRVLPESHVSPRMKELLFSLATRAGRSLGCRGYFRVDFREQGGIPHIIDVNPNPDINEDSGFVRQCGERHISYGDLVEQLVILGMKEGEEQLYGFRASRKMHHHGKKYPSFSERRDYGTPGAVGGLLGNVGGLQTSG